MAYESVKNQIDAYIKANGVNLITGPVLNAVLTTMLDELGEGYAFQGVLDTTDTPSPAADIPQAWLASAGTYLGGSITVDEGELALIIHTSDGWSKETVYRGVQLSYEAIVAALGYTPADDADLAEKQDTIADLSDIRSGSALGSTSVQPMDIENMVEAEPIGSIVPPVNPSEFATKEELSQLEAEKLDKTAAEDTFYITDSNGNIIAQIDNAGVSSVDVKVKVDGVLVSVKSLISSLSGNISTVAGSVATEKARAETEEAKKLDHTLTDDALVIADSNGNIIAKIDAGGVSSPDVLVCVDGNLVSVKTLLSKKIDKELADDSLEIMDSNGYVIFKIDASGAHSAKDKHAVACMVLGEYYYPTATPTRDTNGNITHVAVMFGTGVAGTLDITYTDGNASQVVVEYGDYTYTISILRDAQGNVETVTVN